MLICFKSIFAQLGMIMVRIYSTCGFQVGFPLRFDKHKLPLIIAHTPLHGVYVDANP